MVFDPAAYTEFRYCGAHIDPETFRIDFHYELAGDGVSESFRETISLTPVRSPEDVDWPRVKALVVLLGAVVGLSYYKAAAPKRYVIAVDGMTEQAVAYLLEVITHGLAEFAFRNGFSGPITPEVVVTGQYGEAWPPESHLTPSGDPLVPIGGGKDSVVTVELLAQARMHPVQFGVNPNQVMYRVARIKGHPFIQAKRKLDPRLLELNAIGALNGHIPVTGINSLIAILQARLVGFGPVVMSLEASASEPTLWWDTMPVNHQWSKSEDAEGLLQDVLGPQAGLSAGAYFSLLRPYSELQIARYFSVLREYHPVVTSCNRVFRQGVEDGRWCADCDKCRFIFLILSPFIPSTVLTRMFADNLLDNPSQLEGFRALLGLHEHRPFECVGEQAESMVAMTWIAQQSEWQGAAVVKALVAEIPELTQHHPDLENQVLGHRDSKIPMPNRYGSLGQVLA
jgi:UDP-N-acetyl-alpha-D-muramoyl-L-alanyl-L-glutamate epimerase